jgi:O-methyltransferase
MQVFLKNFIHSFGLKLIPKNNINFPVEANAYDRETINIVSKISMQSPERLFALINSVKYIIKNNIPGDFCEIGVYKGGAALTIGRTLYQLGVTDRKIYLYDTFSGMTQPQDMDIRTGSNLKAQEILSKVEKSDENKVWCIADVNLVKKILSESNYPFHQYFFRIGDINNAKLADCPEQLALLRLDTDWYKSTKTSLELFYSRLTKFGVLIIDDYGHWEGARKAVDEFFLSQKNYPLLNVIDYSGRISIKF